ncbi:MAG: shikimate dehydrogenase [Bacteroidales bacterium]|nr:shikimate dehydrogenase [Bacteroidales bacterium]
MSYHYGLIGNPVDHSLSPELFQSYCAVHGIEHCDYRCYSLDEELMQRDRLRAWVEQTGLLGFNVTIPYKRSILAALDCLSPESQIIGAVNCVRVLHDASTGNVCLYGFNTDAQAFAETLRPLLRPWHRSALIMGTGGAAQAVAYALRDLHITYQFVSRTPDARDTICAPTAMIHPAISYAEAASMAAQHTLIVNATPIGMFPHVEDSPCSFVNRLSPRHLCYDLIYNPPRTRFLIEAAEQGAMVCNGMDMLRCQALLSYRHWHLGQS